MKYGYNTTEDRKIWEMHKGGKVDDLTLRFMRDYYQPLMKRKTITEHETEMLNYFKEMVTELVNHLENEVEKTTK